MKRSRYFIVGIVFIATMLPLSAHAAKAIGKITRLIGTAQILREAVPSPITVTLGMPVYVRDRVRTGADSRLRIELIDGSVMSMGERADINLDEFEFVPEKKKRSAFFRIALGKLRIFARDLLKFKERGFKVRTPTAILGVRGTLFLVWVQSKTITKVVCLENVIEVASVLKPEEFVVLTKDLATDIIEDKAPTKPILMTGDQLRELQKGLEDVPTAPATTETPEATEETTTEETTTEATTTEATTTAATTTAPTTTTSTTTTTTTTTSTTTTTTTTTTTAATTTAATTTTPTTTTTTTTTTLPGPPEPPSG